MQKKSFINKLQRNFKGVLDSFSIYWKAYGGITSLFASAYLWFSFMFSFACFPLWYYSQAKQTAWFDIAISIIPNLLGFTLGGYAILTAFGDDRFKSLVAGRDKKEKISPFMGVNAAFVHFIVMQIFALFFALIAYVWKIETGFFAWFGVFIFVYALSTTLAACFAILRYSKWFDDFITKIKK